MYRLLLVVIAIIMSPVAMAAPACPDGMSLARALFSADIRDREPVTRLEQLPAALSAVYFFTRVEGAGGHDIQHVWSYGGKEIVRVPLRIGGDDWRTWSSKNLGLRRDQDWSVTVLGPGGCRLGEFRLPAGAVDGNGDGGILQRIRALLEQGDLAGARLETKQALANQPAPALRSALHRFLSRELELARAAREIEEQALYTARSRLDALLEQPLEAPEREYATDLKHRLEEDRRALHRQAQQRLDDWRATLEASLGGGWYCARLAREAEALLESLLGPNQPFLVTGRQAAAEGLVLGLLDRRTGDSHEIAVSCLLSPFPTRQDQAVSGD